MKKWLVFCFVIMFVCYLPLAQAAELDQDVSDTVQIMINDEQVTFEHSLYLDDGRLFAPVRNLIEYFTGEVSWDGEKRQIMIRTPHGDTLFFTIDDPRMKFNGHEYVMDTSPFLLDETTYLPIRHVAEFLHMNVFWDKMSKTAIFESVPLYLIGADDSLETISDKFDTTIELLQERNQLESTDLQVDGKLKVIIPSIMKEKITYVEPALKPELPKPEDHPDFYLLAQIIQVEAGYEPYEGQLAVGNVILNRVNSPRFPQNTIREVIYAPGQFPPAHNGLLDKSVPNESVLKAAKAVLSGENNVEGALYFHNPRVTSGGFWDHLTTVAHIGSHRFAK